MRSSVFHWLGLALLVQFGLENTALGGYDPAQMQIPPGFKVTTYVTGSGFYEDQQGVAAIVSMAFHTDGTLYLGRTANRLREMYGRPDAPIYRIPPGRASLNPINEKHYQFGPRLHDPDELGVNSRGEVLVSTRSASGYGSIYRLSRSGQESLFAGGSPSPGKAPLLRDPERIAFDHAENAYVVDDTLGVVVRFDRTGKVLDSRWITGIGRGRTLTFDEKGALWIGSDGQHSAPDEDGYGQIFQYHPASRKLRLAHSGPLPSGMSFSPGGNLFVAQRRSAKLFALTPDGERVEFATFNEGSAIRTLTFPPPSRVTRRMGIAGDLFVMVFPELDFPVREIIRISGPLDSYVRGAARKR